MKKTKEELYKWFWKKFDSCYLVELVDNKGNYYMYYDEQFLRKKKLSRIIGDEEIIYPTKPKGRVLFFQDWKNERLWCDYKEIWSYFEINYIDNHQEIKDLITWMLEEYDKLSVLTPKPSHINFFNLLEEYDKLSVLTPRLALYITSKMLEEYDKLSVLTPATNPMNAGIVLEEYDKLSIKKIN